MWRPRTEGKQAIPQPFNIFNQTEKHVYWLFRWRNKLRGRFFPEDAADDSRRIAIRVYGVGNRIDLTWFPFCTCWAKRIRNTIYLKGTWSTDVVSFRDCNWNRMLLRQVGGLGTYIKNHMHGVDKLKLLCPILIRIFLSSWWYDKAVIDITFPAFRRNYTDVITDSSTTSIQRLGTIGKAGPPTISNWFPSPLAQSQPHLFRTPYW